MSVWIMDGNIGLVFKIHQRCKGVPDKDITVQYSLQGRTMQVSPACKYSVTCYCLNVGMFIPHTDWYKTRNSTL